MEQAAKRKRQLEAASGRRRAALVLKGGEIVNVFTERTERADVAIEDGRIVGIGTYEGEKTVDVSGKLICPGFIDGHIHLESSMVAPAEFEKAVLAHGTTAVITDPHEIANVAGTEGIDYMLKATEGLRLDVFFMLPSCVPATALDESGCTLDADKLRGYYGNPRVLGLAEVMNAPGVEAGDEGLLRKLADAQAAGCLIDGHAPFLRGQALNAYVCAGVASDHECSEAGEALEKLARGQWIMIREGTAARNLEKLMPLFEAPYYKRCMLVTDDKHPGDLLSSGHIDSIVRRAAALGADPIRAILTATLYPAQYFGLKDRGAVAPGMRADLAVLDGLERLQVEQVYKDGVLVGVNGQTLEPERERNGRFDLEQRFPAVFHSFRLNEIRESDLRLTQQGPTQRIIQLQPGELLTRERLEAWNSAAGRPEDGSPAAPGVDPARDILKIAVFERHRASGHIGLGFLGGYGLKRGAVATSVAHDSHNLIVVGTNDGDLALAANAVRESGGGLAVAAGGELLGRLPLPVGGIMSTLTAAQAEEHLRRLKALAAGLGVTAGIDAFMTLAFVSLPVIPALRINSLGIIDVARQAVVPASF